MIVGMNDWTRLKGPIPKHQHTTRKQAFMVVHAVCAAVALLSFASLCVFHTYLQGVGLGTYDWILSKRTPTTATVAVPRPSTTTAPPPAAPSAAPPSAIGVGANGGGGPGKGGGGGQQQGPHVAVAIPPATSTPAPGAGAATGEAPSHSIEMAVKQGGSTATA